MANKSNIDVGATLKGVALTIASLKKSDLNCPRSATLFFDFLTPKPFAAKNADWPVKKRHKGFVNLCPQVTILGRSRHV